MRSPLVPPVFAKLNLKDQSEILVIGAPASFEPKLQALEGVRIVRDPARGGAGPLARRPGAC